MEIKEKKCSIYKKIKLVTVIFITLLLTACKKNLKSEIEMNREMGKFIWEKQDYGELDYISLYYTYPDEYKLHSITTKMETTMIGNRNYGFEETIPKEEREECIEATEILLARAGYDGALNIYVYTDESGGGSYYIDEPEEDENGNCFITCVSDWKDVDYVTGVLLSVYGRYANYGLAYGYANYLCGSLLDVWENVTNATDDNQKNVVNDTQSNELNYVQPVFNAEYNCYDLNLLCFDDDFVTADEIREAIAVSREFVSDYIKNNGEDALKELLKKSGDVQLCYEFNDVLERWYNENGLVLNNPLSEVLYSYGGYSYQYIVYNRYAVFYMDKDWQDTYGTSLPEDFLHKDYAETKKFYEINIEQMRQYNELFELEGTVLHVPVLVSHKKRRSDEVNFTGIYYPDSKIIHLKSVTAFMHEYIHALTVPSSINQKWVFEGWAEAYDYKYNYYKTEAYNYIMNNQDYIFLKEYIEKKGSPIEMVADDKIVGDLLVYGMNDYNYNEGYTPAASFFNYLSDVYGQKKIIDYVCHNHDLTTVTDKSIDELAEDWKIYMEDKYSEYSKNN